MTRTERTTTGRTFEAWRPASLLLGLVVLAFALAGCGGGSSGPPRVGPDASPEVVLGQELVDQSCTACHSKDYTGVSGLGTSFVDSAYIQEHTDAEVVTFIKEGRLNDAPDKPGSVNLRFGLASRIDESDRYQE